MQLFNDVRNIFIVKYNIIHMIQIYLILVNCVVIAGNLDHTTRKMYYGDGKMLAIKITKNVRVTDSGYGVCDYDIYIAADVGLISVGEGGGGVKRSW